MKDAYFCYITTKNLLCNDLVEKDSCISIHHRNLRAFTIKIYRIYNIQLHGPRYCNINFPLRPQDQYNLRSSFDFILPIIRTVNYEIESIRYSGWKIWESIPANIKEVYTIERFESGIKKWKPKSCSWILCKMAYI